MADPSPAPHSTSDGLITSAPRPFDRSLLEATLADAARSAEAAAAPTDELTETPEPDHRTGARLSAPGAQALLSSVSSKPVAAPANPVASVEDRAVDVSALRVGSFGQSSAVPGGEVTLPVVGVGGTRLAPAPTFAHVSPPPAPPAVVRAAPRPAPDLAAPAPPPRTSVRASAPGPPAAATDQPAIRPWQPSDDDILPTSAPGRRGRLRLSWPTAAARIRPLARPRKQRHRLRS